MSAGTGSDRQDLQSNAREPRSRTRVSAEYTYLSDIAGTGNVPYASAYAKENVRRSTTSSSRHSDSSNKEDNQNAVESCTVAPQGCHHHHAAHKISRRSGVASNIASETSCVEQQQHHRHISATTVASPVSPTRPLMIAHRAMGPAPPVESKAKARRDTSRSTANSLSKHSPRIVVDKELLAAKWDSATSTALGDGRPPFSPPVAAAGWDNMQRELEALRKTVQEYHKSSKKQAKKLEELRTQAAVQQQLIQEKETQLETLGQKCSKFEKHISSVESALHCQICMDMPTRPFTLAPCGHVLCLSCLQEWFKTSPGVDDDDDDEDDDVPSHVLYRKKTCPCCRTVVKHRPCPAFMVKDIISTFSQASGTSSLALTSEVAGDSAEDDPWKGIFLSSDDERTLEDDLSDDDDDDVYGIGALSWLTNEGLHSSNLPFPRFVRGYDSDSDESGLFSDERDLDDDADEDDDDDAVSVSESEHAFGLGLPFEYVEPRWEPPSVDIAPDEYRLDPSDRSSWSLLRRGCSWEMIQNFNIRYTHRQGIVVTLRSIDQLYVSDDSDDDSDDEQRARMRDSLHHVYLGWNIVLDDDDEDGETYMHKMLVDIRTHPEAWKLSPRYDDQGSMDVKRLVPVRIGAGGVEEYFSSDSEAWLESEDRDLAVDID